MSLLGRNAAKSALTLVDLQLMAWIRKLSGYIGRLLLTKFCSISTDNLTLAWQQSRDFLLYYVTGDSQM